MEKAITPNSEEFYKVLFEQARDGIFIADDEGRYVDVNESGHRMLRYESGALIGKHITDILRPEDQLRLVPEISLLKAGKSVTREWRLVRKDGTFLDAEITAQQLSNKQLLGVVRDISDRKIAEEGILHLAKGAIGRGQEFFNSMVEYLAKGLRADYAFAGQLFGQNRDCIRTSAVWAEGALSSNFDYALKNTPCANVVGKQLCFYPCDVQALFPQDDLLIQMGINAYIGAPVFDGSGQALGIVVVLWKKPCTEYRTAAPMLQTFAARAGAEWERDRAEKELSTLVDTVDDMIWSVDAQGRWTFVNDAVKNIYGYDPAEMLGRPFTEFETAEQAQKDLEAFARIKAGEPYFKYETEHLHKDGHTIWLSFNAVVLRDSQGTILGTTGTARDITESRRLESQLRQIQKIESIGRLAGGVAHDFNNLLGAILGYSELAQQKIPTESSASRYLAGIVEAARRGGNLTQQLLAFARKKVVKPEVVDLNEIVGKMETMLRRLIGEDLDFIFVPGVRLGRVKVDIGSLEQVIMNLAVNARDAMPKGGKLTLETTNVSIDERYAAENVEVEPGLYALLAVTDTGTGMTDEVRTQIFEPFFTTKPVGQGTGLGLAMCHGIVKQAGGHISVYSEVGRGTTIKIYLPVAQGNLEISKEPVAMSTKGGTETILLVEDEALVRDCAQRALLGLGYKVIEAANGQEALELLSAHKGLIHLLVTDVVMPYMGGPELAKKLVERVPGVKVLYSSGYTENAIVHGGILTEDINFIQKPYLPSELAERIRRILDDRP